MEHVMKQGLVLAFKPEQFSGSTPFSCEKWLRYFKSYSLLIRLSDREKCLVMPLLLNGIAEMWFNSLKKDIRNNWNLLENAFRKRFINDSYHTHDRIIKLLQFKQGKQFFEHYYTFMVSEMSSLGFKEDLQISFIVNNLESTLKCLVLQHQPYNTIAELYERGLYLEKSVEFIYGNYSQYNATNCKGTESKPRMNTSCSDKNEELFAKACIPSHIVNQSWNPSGSVLNEKDVMHSMINCSEQKVGCTVLVLKDSRKNFVEETNSDVKETMLLLSGNEQKDSQASSHAKCFFSIINGCAIFYYLVILSITLAFAYRNDVLASAKYSLDWPVGVFWILHTVILCFIRKLLLRKRIDQKSIENDPDPPLDCIKNILIDHKCCRSVLVSEKQNNGTKFRC